MPFGGPLAPGLVCLTAHEHDERFSWQRNFQLRGDLIEVGSGWAVAPHKIVGGFELPPAGAVERMRMNFGKKGLKLTSRSPEAGEAEVNFACKFEGSDVEIGFNPTFLTEALRVVDSDEISLEMTAPNRPGLLKGGANFVYVIMPVNLQ